MSVVAAARRGSTRLVDHIRSWPWRTSLWPVGLLYSVLATAAVMSNAWGSYIGDNRFEQYVNPARRLAKALGVWDPTRGLGAPREDVWPGTTIPGAVFRGLGAAPWVGERLFHAMCLVTMALGVTALLKLFRPRIGAEHLIAGLYAAFGPYSSAFLVPTNLYYMMALGPWLVVAMVRGLTEDRPWRWAAIFALLIAWAGNPDPPGLLYNAIILVITALYLVHAERAIRWRDVAKWVAAMGALALMCSSWALLKTYFARDMLNARLVDTELPSVSALTSSWSESIRGLGNWLSYFTVSNGLAKPQGASHFLAWWVVLADFAVPLVALLALWRLRWRAKVLFAAMAIVSAAVIVGGFASPTASPVGAAILWVMENVTVLSSFRNTYKAGGGLAIGVGVLAGMGVVAASTALRDRGRFLRRLPAVLAAVVLLTVSFPFWTGSLYHPYQRVGGVPGYWTDAFDYLDAMPDPGLTAVVPAITRANYRWGWVGDDIFDALLSRPHAVSTGVPLSNPLGANALESFTLAAQSVPYRPGVLGSMARRLGITEIVVRNDLQWEGLGLPRPSAFDGLRHDADFELAATFGEPGDGVVAFKDHSNSAIPERSLPPIEIYRVRQPGSLLRSVSGTPGVLLAGDANAWPVLETSGLAGSATPITTSGAVPDDRILDTVRSTAGVVITDTARRRLRTLVDYEPSYSATLGLRQDAGRLVREQFPDNVTAQSSVWFPDAESISSVGFTFSQIPVSYRPANAFDGDPATAWAVNWVLSDEIPGIEVKLRSPHEVTSFDLSALLSADDETSVRRVSVTLDDGTQRQAFTDEQGLAHIEFPPTRTASFVVRLEGIDTTQGLVGLREVKVAGLDLREFIQSPTDLFGTRVAGGDLGPSVSSVPTAYAFTRSTRTTYLSAGGTAAGRFDEDQTIRRRFDVARADDYALDGLLRRSASTTSEEMNRWLPTDVSASATGSDPAGLEGLPVDVLDGSIDTAWIAPRPLDETLTLHVPRQRVQRVVVAMQIEGQAVGASLVTARVGDTTVSVSPVADASCPPYVLADIQARADDEPSSEPCYRRAVFEFSEPIETDHVELTLERFDLRINRFGSKWFVNEVDVSGPDRTEAQNKVDRSAAVGGECVDTGLRVGTDGTASTSAPVPITFHSTVGALLDGAPIPYRSCQPVTLTAPVAVLDSGSHGLFESIVLRTADWPVAASTETSQPASFVSSDRAEGAVQLDTAGTLIFGQSFDPLWQLSVDGGAPSAPNPVNGMNAWAVPAGSHHVVFTYRPERLLAIGIVVSLLGVAMCGGLVMGGRRRRVASADLSGWEFVHASRRASYWAIAAATAVGVLLIGPLALVVGVAGILVARFVDEPVTITGAAAPALLLVATFSSAASLFVGTHRLGLAYSKARPWAHQLTLVAMVFAVQTVALLAVAARRRAPATSRGMGWPWPRTAKEWVTAGRTSWRLSLALVVAFGVRIAAAAVAHDAGGVAGLVENIRLGTKYSTTTFGGSPAVDLAPLAPVLRATIRVSPALLSGLIVLATCVVAVRWAARRLPAVPAWWVVVAIAISPLSWGVALGGQIAALAVLTAAFTLDVGQPSRMRAAAAGVLLGAGVLARPDAVVVVLGVVVLLLIRRRTAVGVSVLAGACITAAGWAAFCWSAGTAPWLASSALAMVQDRSTAGPGRWLTWWLGLGMVLALSVAVRRRSGGQAPASD